jgi:hypothetical protein
MKPAIPADVTPPGALHAVGSASKASRPSADEPALRVVVSVVDVGWPGAGLIAGNVTLGMTVPER